MGHPPTNVIGGTCLIFSHDCRDFHFDGVVENLDVDVLEKRPWAASHLFPPASQPLSFGPPLLTLTPSQPPPTIYTTMPIVREVLPRATGLGQHQGVQLDPGYSLWIQRTSSVLCWTNLMKFSTQLSLATMDMDTSPAQRPLTLTVKTNSQSYNKSSKSWRAWGFSSAQRMWVYQLNT